MTGMQDRDLLSAFDKCIVKRNSAAALAKSVAAAEVIPAVE